MENTMQISAVVKYIIPPYTLLLLWKELPDTTPPRYTATQCVADQKAGFARMARDLSAAACSKGPAIADAAPLQIYGDGKHDDSDALQALINGCEIPYASDGILARWEHLRPGRYLVTKTLLV